MIALAKRAVQVSIRLSQPAVAVAVSPTAIDLAHGLPELDLNSGCDEPVVLDLHGAASIGAGREREDAAREPAVGVVVETVDDEASGVGDGGDGRGCAELGLVEVDGASGVAEVGVAGVLEETAARLLEIVGEAAHFGGEGGARAAHFAERAFAGENALRGILPVDAEDLDGGVVEVARGERDFREAVGDEGAGDFEIVDAEADLLADLAGGEAAGRFERRAVEAEVVIVFGEAEPRTVATGETPAPAQRRRTRLEVRR